MHSVSKDDFKSVMGSFAAGVTVVSTVDGTGKKWGMTATAFCSLSLEPPLCLVCVDRRAGSYGPLLESRKFGVSLLSSAQEDLSKRFASRIEDKFSGVPHRIGEVTGCPLLEGALAQCECEVVDVFAGGDHDIFVGRVCSSSVDGDGRPLVHWRGRYREVTARG
jgi:flavin reductase (DIM6/NTAB) family NADH-FMN oxidoreductase RutF